jgi:hypothetical protein
MAYGRLPKHLHLHLSHLEDALIQSDLHIWKKVLWSDETKMLLFGHQGKCYVWHKPNTSHHPENTHPHSEAWWWQHHSVGMFFTGMDWETGQN